MLTKFKKGTNLLLLNTLYCRPKKINDNEYEDDVLYLIYKNLDDGKKYIEEIKRPNIDIYVAKPDIELPHNVAFLSLDEVDKISVPYKDVAKSIAQLADDRIGMKKYINYYYECIMNKEYYRTNNLHKWKYVFGSDMNIEDYIRVKFFEEYGEPSSIKFRKAYLDIEVDSIKIPGFPAMGECPINAVTIIDDNFGEVTSYTFLLENDDNPQINELKDDLEGFKQELKDSFEWKYGKIDYKFLFYKEKEEIYMIRDIFKLINAISPDFLLIWNLPFDAAYLNERCIVLGYEPADIMCSDKFYRKECYLYIDKNTRTFEKKGDFFFISSETVWMDQLINYASLRIAKKKMTSYALNAVAQIELQDEKLDYTEEANIKVLPYKNYRKFVKYNIKDVLLQLGIERKNSDIESIYYSTMSNFTRYSKIFKQSVFLKNRAYYEFLQQGLAMTNNLNSGSGESEEVYLTDEDNEKFEGALVGDPLLNGHNGMEINGRQSKYIYENVIDYDFSSMYPNIICSFNIFTSTQYGRLLIPDKVYDGENPLKQGNYDRGGEFMDNYHTHDFIQTGTRWFNLPSIENMIYDIEKSKGRKIFKRINKPFFRRISNE
jgi:DNA polymerase elongation subunit (family B)